MEMTGLNLFPDDETSQKEFMQNLAPFLRLARAQGKETLFLERMFNLWFVRWPIKVTDCKNRDLLAFTRSSIEKV